jgi:hypothetical protein
VKIKFELGVGVYGNIVGGNRDELCVYVKSLDFDVFNKCVIVGVLIIDDGDVDILAISDVCDDGF